MLLAVALPAWAAPPPPIPNVPINAANAHMNMVCEKSGTGPGASGDFHDQTAEANTKGGPYDVILGDDATNTGSDYVMFGMKNVFIELHISIHTAEAPVKGQVRWEYWDGNAWQTFTPHTDTTNHFKTLGTGAVKWNLFADWQKNAAPSSNCPYSYYFVKATTTEDYTVQPLADQVSSVEFNVKVKIQDELGTSLAGVTRSDVEVTGGTRNEVFAWRDLGGGEYEGALRMGEEDNTYDLSAGKPGYVRSDKLATGEISNALKDRTATPLSLPFAIKVVVKDANGNDVTGAALKRGTAAPTTTQGAAYYFAATGSGALSVSKDGYVAFDTTQDTKAQDVRAGTTAQTVVTLSGTTKCSGATEVAAGTAVTCRGLSSTGSTPTTSTSKPTTASSSRPTSTTATSSKAPTVSPSLTGTLTEAQVTSDGSAYSALLASVDSDTRIRLLFEGQEESGLERVDVVLGEAATDVRVVVQRSEALDPAWGVPTPAGRVFGYLSIQVFAGGASLQHEAEFTLIEFRVAKEQLRAAGVQPGEVHVSRWDGEAWAGLPTDPSGEEIEHQRFSAAGPGNGYFAIASEASEVSGGFPIPWTGIAAGVVLLNLIIGGCLYVFRTSNKAREAQELP